MWNPVICDNYLTAPPPSNACQLILRNKLRCMLANMLPLIGRFRLNEKKGLKLPLLHIDKAITPKYAQKNKSITIGQLKDGVLGLQNLPNLLTPVNLRRTLNVKHTNS